MKIPIFTTPDTPLSSSTQNFVIVSHVKDGVVFFKDGGAALIMESTSLNFQLLSDREQKAIIYAYAALLNSFNFHIEIVVRSQKKDITSYFQTLDQAEIKITNPKIKILMRGYKDFIKQSIKKKNVLSKNFYVIVPFTAYELGITKSFTKFLSPKKSEVVPYPKRYVERKAKIALYPKRDHLIRQGNRLGIQLRQMTDEELIHLVYEIYNPSQPAHIKLEY